MPLCTGNSGLGTGRYQPEDNIHVLAILREQTYFQCTVKLGLYCDYAHDDATNQQSIINQENIHFHSFE